MQELRRLRYFQVNVIICICNIFHCYSVAFFFQIWLLLYLMTFLKILSESSVPSGPVCNVSILITYICTCTSIWFSIPDIHIHYENLFMIKKDWTVLYFVYSHHVLQASFVMTDIVTKVLLTKLRWLLFHTNT